MNLMKKTAVVLWAIAWVVTQTAKGLIISFVDVMRYALGEDGEPVSIITFLFCLAGSVAMVSFAAVTIAALKVN